jgi:hypothetical protein
MDLSVEDDDMCSTTRTITTECLKMALKRL